MKNEKLITPNFSWHEMTASPTARKHAIKNNPGPREWDALEWLVNQLLQPLRDFYGQPIRVSSGYRSAKLNRLVGGVPGSQHTRGEAADCVTADAALLLDALLRSGLAFDQAILYRRRNFLHLSLRRQGNRKEVITYNS